MRDRFRVRDAPLHAEPPISSLFQLISHIAVRKFSTTHVDAKVPADHFYVCEIGFRYRISARCNRTPINSKLTLFSLGCLLVNLLKKHIYVNGDKSP